MRLSLLIIFFGAFISSANAAEKPNIVIILADDLGYADLGFRGSDIQTPNIDRLASEGMVPFAASPALYNQGMAII